MQRLKIQWKFMLVLMIPLTFSFVVAWVLSFWIESLGKILLISMISSSILGILLSYRLSQQLTRPLHQIMDLSRRLALGEFGSEVKIESRDEIGELGMVLNHMTSALKARMTGISEDRIRLTAILSSMVEGVMVLDCRGTILMVNKALERMFQLGDQEAIGRPFLEVLRHHPLIELLKSLLDTRISRSEEVVIKGIQEFYFHVQASAGKNCSEGEVCAVLVFHDITETKRLERVRKDFVANVSHELKTPLTSIKGYIEALIDGAKDDPKICSDFLRIIQKHTNSLSSILSDLLQLSTIESGHYLWSRDVVSMPELIDKAVRIFRPTAEKKKQSLTMVLSDGIDNISGDADKLILVFINLIDNAVKYTPEGGTITIEAKQTKDAVEISVNDTGIGIPAKEIPRIFERFYRVDRAYSRELSGTGLGLSIVKHIVDAHGGIVRVQSEPRKGSRFTVVLPLNQT